MLLCILSVSSGGRNNVSIPTLLSARIGNSRKIRKKEYLNDMYIINNGYNVNAINSDINHSINSSINGGSNNSSNDNNIDHDNNNNNHDNIINNDDNDVSNNDNDNDNFLNNDRNSKKD